MLSMQLLPYDRSLHSHLFILHFGHEYYLGKCKVFIANLYVCKLYNNNTKFFL